MNVAPCPIPWLCPPSHYDFSGVVKMALNLLCYLIFIHRDATFKLYHVGMRVGNTSLQTFLCVFH